MPEPTGADLEAIFRRQIDAFGAKDVDRLMSCYTEDCVLQDMADPDSPFVGLSEVRAFLDGYFACLDEPVVEITSIASGLDVVAGELEVVAGYRMGPDAEATVKPVRLRYSVVDIIRGNLIERERFYWDSGDLARQLDADSTHR